MAKSNLDQERNEIEKNGSLMAVQMVDYFSRELKKISKEKDAKEISSIEELRGEFINLARTSDLSFLESLEMDEKQLADLLIVFLESQSSEKGGMLRNGKVDLEWCESALNRMAGSLKSQDDPEFKSSLSSVVDALASKKGKEFSKLADRYTTQAKTITEGIRDKITLSTFLNPLALATTTVASGAFAFRLVQDFLRGVYLDSEPNEWVHQFLGSDTLGLDFQNYDNLAGLGSATSVLASIFVARQIQQYGQKRGWGKARAAIYSLGLTGSLVAFDTTGTIASSSAERYLEDSRNGTISAIGTVVDTSKNEFTPEVGDKINPNSPVNKVQIEEVAITADKLTNREDKERGGTGPISESYQSLDTGELSDAAGGNLRVVSAFNKLKKSIQSIEEGSGFAGQLQTHLENQSGAESGLDDFYKIYLEQLMKGVKKDQLPKIVSAIETIKNAETAPQLEDAQRILVRDLEDLQSFVNDHGEALAQVGQAYNDYIKALQESGNASYSKQLSIEQVELPEIKIDLSSAIEGVKASLPEIESQSIPQYLERMWSSPDGQITLAKDIARLIATDIVPLFYLIGNAFVVDRRNRPKEKALTAEFLKFVDELREQINNFLSSMFPKGEFKPYTTEEVLEVVEDLLGDKNPDITSYSSKGEEGQRFTKAQKSRRAITNYVKADSTRHQYKRLKAIAVEFDTLRSEGEEIQEGLIKEVILRLAQPYIDEDPSAVNNDRQESLRQFKTGEDNREHLESINYRVYDELKVKLKEAKKIAGAESSLIDNCDNSDVKAQFKNFKKAITAAEDFSVDKSVLEGNLNEGLIETFDKMEKSFDEFQAYRESAIEITKKLEDQINDFTTAITPVQSKLKSYLSKKNENGEIVKIRKKEIKSEALEFLDYFTKLDRLDAILESLSANFYQALNENEELSKTYKELEASKSKFMNKEATKKLEIEVQKAFN